MKGHGIHAFKEVSDPNTIVWPSKGNLLEQCFYLLSAGHLIFSLQSKVRDLFISYYEH